jgi:hypothetical protein
MMAGVREVSLKRNWLQLDQRPDEECFIEKPCIVTAVCVDLERRRSILKRNRCRWNRPAIKRVKFNKSFEQTPKVRL